jgi:GMP synthase (glutamine-hydrolysing)
MDVLGVIHGDNCRSGTFGEVALERGHRLDEWSLAWETPIPKPLDSYGAVFVFGGAMHADQDEHHPWLTEETLFLQRLLDLGLPTLGVCLGAQLLARAAHAPVMPAPEPEIGWLPVELTGEAAGDPVLGGLPPTFEAFQWHSYTYGVPAGAVELARSPVCTQAFRLGSRVWGIQFHAEITGEQIESWSAEEPDVPPPSMPAETARNLDLWQSLGRRLCGDFLGFAEGVRAAA